MGDESGTASRAVEADLWTLLGARLRASGEASNGIPLVRAAVSRYGLADVRRAARRWASAGSPQEQAVGALTLGALGIDDEQSRDALVAAAGIIATSPDRRVRVALARSLGWCSTDGRTTPTLLALADDPAGSVRRAAVQGLSVPADDERDDGGDVTAVLLRRFHDPEPRVRDWAVFALGVTRDADGPEVRAAFVARLDDEQADTAGEAAVALGRRRDGRVLPVLLQRLSDPEVGFLWVEAAAALGDPRLLPALLSLRDTGWRDDDCRRPTVLDDAIIACSAPTHLRP